MSIVESFTQVINIMQMICQSELDLNACFLIKGYNLVSHDNVDQIVTGKTLSRTERAHFRVERALKAVVIIWNA